MTSYEKDNHQKMLIFLDENHYFGRSKESFIIEPQPLVPLISEKKEFVFSEKMTLMMKPFGHGALWPLLLTHHFFEHFKKLGKTKAFIRQVNNPIAGIDDGLMRFLSHCLQKKVFWGFATCEKKVGSEEGMIVEKKEKDQLRIVNIEYTDFQKEGIQEKGVDGSDISIYPANTNLLFVDLNYMQLVIQEHPFAKMILNMKTEIVVNGEKYKAGRLELLMQGLADYLNKEQVLVTKNYREKTIAPTKRLKPKDGSYSDTPLAAYYLFQKNYHFLLEECGFKIPQLRAFESYIQKDMPLHIDLHASLGPMFSAICKKIANGSMKLFSELQLQLSDARIDQMDLDGSFVVIATDPFGKKNLEKNIYYSNNTGRLIMENVKIENKGIDRQAQNIFWKNEIYRKESFKIILQGSAEAVIQNCTIKGNLEVVIPDGQRWTLQNINSDYRWIKEKIN